MNTIYIGFSKPKNFAIGAWLISLWMRKPYSHTFLVFDRADAPSGKCVYHASHGSVHYSDYKEFTGGNEIVRKYEINVSDAQFQDIISDANKVYGEPYDFLDLAKIVLYDICRTFGMKFDSYDGKGYICSELMGRVCSHLKVEFQKERFFLTPADIDNALAPLYAAVTP